MSIQLQDSLQRALLAPPSAPGQELAFYACGITPYSPSHIGHARSFVVFDLMRRVLEQSGWSVALVRNVTDIDDKIIEAARSAGVHWKTLSWDMHARNEREMAQLLATGHETPKASEYIPEMHDLIGRLHAKGMAYQAPSGDMLFRSSAFQGARLMPHDPESLGAPEHARVSSEGKESPADFVLWKGSKPDEPSWDSPWGAGRPGWHLECSAMIESRFGRTLDYHGGGTDLRFPHHQAEIQQSEGAYDRPLAHRWVHHGSVRDVDGRKMSKSLGNVVVLADALDEANVLAPGAGGVVLRMALLDALWTKPLDWDPAAPARWTARLQEWATLARFGGEVPASTVREALASNLNTPRAFAELSALARLARHGDEAAQFKLADGLGMLGLDEEVLAPLKTLPPKASAEVEALLAAREVAREQRDWAASDRLRAELQELGWQVQDKKAPKP